MLIDHRWAVCVLALWEPSGTDPAAYRSPAKTAVASCVALGDTLANLFHHGLITYQPPFPLLLLRTLHSRKRHGGVGRRSNGGSGRLRLLARGSRHAQSSIPSTRGPSTGTTNALRRNWRRRVEALARMPSCWAKRDPALPPNANAICSIAALNRQVRRA